MATLIVIVIFSAVLIRQVKNTWAMWIGAALFTGAWVNILLLEARFQTPDKVFLSILSTSGLLLGALFEKSGFDRRTTLILVACFAILALLITLGLTIAIEHKVPSGL